MPSPIDFKKLFANKDKYPDTIKIKIGDDSEMELGVLRAYDAENQGALVKELESKRAELNADAEKVDKARREVANLYLSVEEEKRKLATQPKATPSADPYEGLTEDPIAGKLALLVKSQSESNSAEIKAIREENKKLLDAIGKMGVTYMNDRARTDYASLASDPDYKADDASLSMDKLYESAVRNKYTDAAGIPDVKKAFRDATSEKRTARLVKEAEERGRKSAEDDRRMNANLPRPSGIRPAGLQVPEYKDMEGAINAALQDKTIWVAEN